MENQESSQNRIEPKISVSKDGKWYSTVSLVDKSMHNNLQNVVLEAYNS